MQILFVVVARKCDLCKRITRVVFFMINRVLIRLKVIQVVYAYYKNSGKSIKAAEDEVFFSLSKAYDLYKFLLLLIVAVTHYAADRISFNMRKVRPTEADINPNLKFVNNRLAAQIEANEELIKFSEKSKLDWVNYSDFLRRLLDTIIESDIYTGVSPVLQHRVPGSSILPEGTDSPRPGSY